jgi:hypothetical protein
MDQGAFPVLSAASIQQLHDGAASQGDFSLFPQPRKRSEKTVVDAKGSAADLVLRKSVARSVGKEICEFEPASWLSSHQTLQSSTSYQTPLPDIDSFPCDLTNAQGVTSQDSFAVLSASSIQPYDAVDACHVKKSSKFPPPTKSWRSDNKVATPDRLLRKSVARSVGQELLRFESGSWVSSERASSKVFDSQHPLPEICLPCCFAPEALNTSALEPNPC